MIVCDRCNYSFGDNPPSSVSPVQCKCGNRVEFAVGTEAERKERQARIASKVASTKRLLGWLRRFRLSTEIGIGDTAQRLVIKSYRHPKAGAALIRLLKQSNCNLANAVTKLNKQYPY